MDMKLILTGILGLTLCWAVFESNLYASILAGIVGLISLIGGLKKIKK